MSAKEREIAHSTQEKFEFYVLSLVFTLLALSIQTAKFGEFKTADVLELAGWICLLVSGIAGLWRLEYIPVERMKLAQKNEYEDRIFQLKDLQQLKGQTTIYVLESGQNELISSRIGSFEKATSALGPVIDRLAKSNLRKYAVHRYAFVLALGCLLGSRAFPAIAKLVS